MVSTTWKKWGLQPWRVEKFKLSTDPELEAKIRDVVGLYLNPPDKAVVLCIDEKSQIQALDRTAPVLPLRIGVLEKASRGRQGRCGRGGGSAPARRSRSRLHRSRAAAPQRRP